MNEPNNKWKGLRAIVVVRQSDDKEGTGSTAAQLDFMSKELVRVEMKYVDKEVLEGVKASAPARISELLQKLFKRKRDRNDFEVIAWQVEDRASRGGGEHGLWLEHEAKRQGLRVFFAGDDAVAGPYAPLVRVAKYETAKETSVSIGRRTAQGQKWAQKQGFYRTAGQTPLGCDRLYCGADDQPKFIIHNLISGLQEQRAFATGKVIAQFGSVGKKSRNRYRKQRNEYSLLVPGDREQRRVVRVIFYLRYKRGWRGARIASFLNRNGISSPKGKHWSPRQVEIIYENEAYTGSTCGRTFSGRYFRRDNVLGFVPLNRDEIELVVKKTFSPVLRPKDDWERIDQPYMHDFLPRDVRAFAIPSLTKLWENRADPTRPKREMNAHPDSTYLLSGRLRDAHVGEELKGTLSGAKDSEKTPYYRHPKSRRERQAGSIYNNLIAAEPLHQAIIDLLGETLADTPDLRARLKQHVLDQRSVTEHDQPDVAKLETERDEIQNQIRMILGALTGSALAAVGPELQRLGDRRNSIEAQLTHAKSKHAKDQRPLDQIVNEAIAVLNTDRQQLLTLPIEPLRDLVNRLVVEASVDMDTKAVRLTIALPAWALRPQAILGRNGRKAPENANSAMCPDETLRSPSGEQTHTLGRSLCEYHSVRGSRLQRPCYVCQRIAA